MLSLAREVQLNEGHVHVSHLVEEEVGVACVVLGREGVWVESLEVEEYRVNEVLMQNFVLAREHLPLGGGVCEWLVQGLVVFEWAYR